MYSIVLLVDKIPIHNIQLMLDNHHSTLYHQAWLLMQILSEGQNLVLATDHLLLLEDEILVNITLLVPIIGTILLFVLVNLTERYENNHQLQHYDLPLLAVLYVVSHPALVYEVVLNLLLNQTDLNPVSNNVLLLMIPHLQLGIL
jgi:hypothetical protein